MWVGAGSDTDTKQRGLEALTSNAVGGSGLVRKWTSLATRFCSSAKSSGSWGTHSTWGAQDHRS